MEEVFVWSVVCFGATAPSGSGPPHSRGFSRSHTTDAPQAVRLLWTSDQLVAQTSTWQHTTLTTNIHAPGGIRTHNRSRRAAADLRLRLRATGIGGGSVNTNKYVWRVSYKFNYTLGVIREVKMNALYRSNIRLSVSLSVHDLVSVTKPFGRFSWNSV